MKSGQFLGANIRGCDYFLVVMIWANLGVCVLGEGIEESDALLPVPETSCDDDEDAVGTSGGLAVAGAVGCKPTGGESV